MKKIGLLFTLLMVAPSMIGCDSKTLDRITYGTLYHETSVEIDNDTLYSKKDSENFLLATYGDTSCGCWGYFSTVLDVLSKYQHILTYKISDTEIDERLNAFGIKNSVNPAFYIIANGKVIRRVFYTDNSSYFTDENKLLELIKNTVELPYMYFINEEQIKSEVIDNNGIIYYTRLSCPDCNYCTPNVLMPRFKYWQTNSKIYVFDLDPIKKEEPDRYQQFKDDHFLSNKNNQEFGYKTGFVPTFQYYKDGKLFDMAVYFNDEITDGVITDSYYSEERNKYLKYTVNLTRKELVGTKLSAYDLNTAGKWKDNESHSRYYEPFIDAFFDFYFI